jgi:hypothetical protein
MPERSSTAGECSAPAHTITSPARIVCELPPRLTTAPVMRRPSLVSRSTWVWSMIEKFGRWRVTGSR